jgi:hypothetical protein
MSVHIYKIAVHHQSSVKWLVSGVYEIIIGAGFQETLHGSFLSTNSRTGNQGIAETISSTVKHPNRKRELIYSEQIKFPRTYRLTA